MYTAYAETPLDEDETEAMAAEGRMRTGRMERFACSILPLWIAVAVGGCDSHGPAVSEARSPGEAGSQVVVEFSSELERPLESNYLLFLPTDYGRNGDQAWPLIVHLHGGGGRGSDPERLRIYPMVKRVDQDPSFPRPPAARERSRRRLLPARRGLSGEDVFRRSPVVRRQRRAPTPAHA